MKKPNAIFGIIILVAIVVVIACFVYAYIDSMVVDENIREKLNFNVIDYSINDHNYLNFKMVFINDNGQLDGKIHLELKILQFENRTIYDTIPVLIKDLNVTIAKGDTVQEFNEITTVYNAVYSIELTLKIGDEEMGKRFLVIDKER